MGYKRVTFDEGDIKKIFKTDTPVGNAWRMLKRFSRTLAYLAVVYIAVFYSINYSALLKRLEYSYDKVPSVETPTQPTPTPEEPIPSYSPEIIIEKIGIKAPIILGVTASNVVGELSNGVVHYPDSAYPNQVGNFVLVGHSSDYPWSTGRYKNVFALLDKLTAGDTISVPFEDQIFTYEVIGTKIVKPTDVSVLKKTNQATLTLITCYPVGTTRSRLILTAKLISGETYSSQETDPLTTSLPSPR